MKDTAKNRMHNDRATVRFTIDSAGTIRAATSRIGASADVSLADILGMFTAPNQPAARRSQGVS